MIFVSRKISVPANSEKEYYIRPGKNQLFIAAYCPGQAHYRIYRDNIIFSEKKAVKTGFAVVVADTHWIPVMSIPGAPILIKVKTFDTPLDETISFILAEKNEIKDTAQRGVYHQWLLGAQDFGLMMNEGDNIILFENKYHFSVFLIGLLNFGTDIVEGGYTLYINDTILDFEGEPPAFRSSKRVLPLYVTIHPGEKLIWKSIDTWTEDWVRPEVLLSKYPVTLPDDLLFNLSDPFLMPRIDGVINIFDIPKPTPPPNPQPLPDNTPPYPIPPDEQEKLEPQLPEEHPLDRTTLLQSKGNISPTFIKIAGEQSVVEALPSPFGAIRKNADIRGRQRISSADISYRSGQLQITDTTENTILSDIVIKRISLYASAGDWNIRILPLYDFLCGKNITDMGIIYLKEGQSFDEDIEAVEIRATCTNASETTPGRLNWFGGI